MPRRSLSLNVLLCGASGYAGYAAALALRRAGHRVAGLLRDPASARAQELRGRQIDVLAGDLRRPATYRAALAACDVCLSAALEFQDPAGTDRLLLETLRGLPAGAGGTKRLFVYTSCGAAYGQVPARQLDETTPGNPAHPLHFRLELEQEVFQLDNVRTVVVRPGFLYGQDGRSCFASTWFEPGEAGRVVYGGNPARAWSWLHVSDLAAAYGRLLAHPGLDREVFCLADDHQPRGLDVARAAAQAAGFTGPVEVGPASWKTAAPCSTTRCCLARPRPAKCWAGYRSNRAFWPTWPAATRAGRQRSSWPPTSPAGAGFFLPAAGSRARTCRPAGPSLTAAGQ